MSKQLLISQEGKENAEKWIGIVKEIMQEPPVELKVEDSKERGELA